MGFVYYEPAMSRYLKYIAGTNIIAIVYRMLRLLTAVAGVAPESQFFWVFGITGITSLGD